MVNVSDGNIVLSFAIFARSLAAKILADVLRSDFTLF